MTQPGAVNSYDALANLVAEPETFYRRRPQVPTLHRNPSPNWLNTLTPEACDQIVTDRGVRFPFVQVARDGGPITTARYAWDRGHSSYGLRDEIRASAVQQLVRDGATVIFNGLARTWEPVRTICRGLSQELGTPVSASAFLTPNQSQGFRHHHDTEDVFLAQMAGSKTWELYEPLIEAPLGGIHDWPPKQLPTAELQTLQTREPDYKFELKPGDILYFPRGWIHNGYCQESASLHVTFGLGDTSRYRLARHIMNELAHHPTLRSDMHTRPSPAHEHLVDAIQEVRQTLINALQELDIQPAIDSYRREILKGYEGPRVTAVSWLFSQQAELPERVRADLTGVISITNDSDSTILELPDRVVSLPKCDIHKALPEQATNCKELVRDGISAQIVKQLLNEGILQPA